jgi:hypothetical protein
LLDVSLVHPTWEREVGHLASFNVCGARQWVYRRLRNFPGILAIGSFEACVNTELDGSQHWAVGFHLITAGPMKMALTDALDVPSGKAGARTLVINEVANLGRQLGYALKHFVEERRAYLNARNGRVQRRHIPPSAQLWTEHDAWLAQLPSGGRTISISCQRRGGRFTR